jgi:subtilisin family serine protease
MKTMNQVFVLLSSIIIFALLATGLIASAKSSKHALPSAQDWSQSKLTPWVIANTADGREAALIVVMADQAKIDAVDGQTKEEKGKYVRDMLWEKAQMTQASLLDWLRTNGVEHKPFYIVNAVWVKGSREIAEAIAARPDVARIEGNPQVRNREAARLTEEEMRSVVRRAYAPQAIEPGVTAIHAPEVWNLGFRGENIVIGSIDTGVKWDHFALKGKYRGWNGKSADHNYNWHDSIHSGGGMCGPDSIMPCDDNNHGTHTVGTAVGDNGQGDQIGVAPNAKFVACRAMNQLVGTPTSYMECLEWMLAPYPIGGTPAQGNSTKAPDIVLNAWTCSPAEGCTQSSMLQQAIINLRNVGIMVVGMSGSNGPTCSSVVDPPAIYDETYTVGAVDPAGNVASFSGRGPVTVDGSNRLKPDILAPGVSVRSALIGGYGSFSGTSMSAAHVAGAVALLWSARPALKRHVDDTELLLNDAAFDLPNSGCNSSALVPNNVTGFGRLDIKAAVDLTAATISPSSMTFDKNGGTGSVTVTASGLNWAAFSNASWITVTAGATGNGNGTVSYSIAVNNGGMRTGTLGIAGRLFTVTQTGGLQFYPLPRPVRLLDTRAAQGNCDSVSAPIQAGTSITTLARITCESITIPTTAQAIVGNITVINQTAQTGYLTVYPDGQPTPLAANMIYGPNNILANNFTVGLSAAGNFNIFGERTIDVVVDVSGYYAPPGTGGLYFHPLPNPVRLLDTRANQGNCDSVVAPIAAGTSLTKLARTTCEGLTIPTAAQAIVGNATALNGSGQFGYLTIYPNGVPAPLAANIVYSPGQFLSNAFTTSLSTGGEFNIFSERTIDMVIDVAGYYSNEAVDVNGPGLLFTPLSRPVRILDTRAMQGNCDSVGAPITEGNSIAVPGRLTCESITIPPTALTVLGNVTVINQTGSVGVLTLYPDGVPQPLTANMIYYPNQTLSNAFVVGVNAGTGHFRIFAERTLDAIVDVSGYFAP